MTAVFLAIYYSGITIIYFTYFFIAKWKNRKYDQQLRKKEEPNYATQINDIEEFLATNE